MQHINRLIIETELMNLASELATIATQALNNKEPGAADKVAAYERIKNALDDFKRG